MGCRLDRLKREPPPVETVRVARKPTRAAPKGGVVKKTFLVLVGLAVAGVVVARLAKRSRYAATPEYPSPRYTPIPEPVKEEASVVSAPVEELAPPPTPEVSEPQPVAEVSEPEPVAEPDYGYPVSAEAASIDEWAEPVPATEGSDVPMDWAAQWDAMIEAWH